MQPTTTATVARRHLLRGSGVAAAIAVAGCLGSLQPNADDDSNGDDESNNADSNGEELDDRESNGDDDDDVPDPSATIDAYLEAAAEEDVETMSDVSHELHPFDPESWVEAGWEFEGSDGEVPDYDADVRTTDGTVDDVYAVETAEFWFAETDLEDELEGESIAVVEVTAEDQGLEERSRWVLATEDDEWRILVQGDETETPEDPESVFEDPVEDEDDDVVVEIDWEYERPDEFGFDDSNDAFEVTQAEVTLTDSPGIEAHTVRAEATIGDGSASLYDPDYEPGGWAGSRIYPTYDPDGDQIVVTAIAGDDDDETIVHREQYLPDGDD